jgi:thiol-disulfide isomerase/thioredoxin
MKTMRKLFKYIPLVLFIFVLQSCDEITEYEVELELEDATELSRKAVMFEFTGIYCTNCPSAHEVVHKIDSVYHGHVIPIAVHAGGFAEAVPGLHPDFTTEFGDQLFESLAGEGVPSALIATLDGDQFIEGAESTWMGELGYFVPQFTKYLVEPTISIADNTINASFQITDQRNTGKNVLFYGFIVEDHIIGYQTNGGSNYDHRHVLRKCYTNHNGNSLAFSEGVASMNSSIEIHESWNQENLYVVGIIVDADTKEIYTGEQVKLVN